jgi:outer membrane biosynthesis protein TonB
VAREEDGMTLLLAMLLCAPERITIVARRAEKPSPLARLESTLGAAWKRLYQKEDDQIGDANALAAQGDAEGALKVYDAARPRLGEDPALSFDRSAALLKIADPSAAAEASSEAARAFDRGDSSLTPKAAYQRALAAESMGQPEDAMKLYASALALDPGDVDSKVNLELLLRTQEERKKQQAGRPQPTPQKKDQAQQQPDPSKGQDQQGQDKQAGKQQEKKQDDAQPQPGADPQAKAPEKKPQQSEQKAPDRSEAERLLDALRTSEKNLQMWRFAKKSSKEARRGDVEKDW